MPNLRNSPSLPTARHPTADTAPPPLRSRPTVNTGTTGMYRVGHLVRQLGWVDYG